MVINRKLVIPLKFLCDVWLKFIVVRWKGLLCKVSSWLLSVLPDQSFSLGLHQWRGVKMWFCAVVDNAINHLGVCMGTFVRILKLTFFNVKKKELFFFSDNEFYFSMVAKYMFLKFKRDAKFRNSPSLLILIFSAFQRCWRLVNRF